jgi:TP901 family phage tail tape measure protein
VTDLSLRARLTLDPQQWGSGLRVAGDRLKGFTSLARREVGALHDFMKGTAGRIASLAGGITVAGELLRSARMDKTLTQIGLTADLSQRQVAGLRRELFAMAKESGQQVENLQQGANNLIAQGLGLKETLNTLRAINRATPVTGASPDTLAGALGVASTAYTRKKGDEFDLAAPRTAADLLDKMTVAGRKGNAELENLSSIFARVGVNGAGAGMTFDKTLAFIEGLSLIERQPERLATLADSTLRLFTNAKYRADAQKATGIQFFQTDGSRRDPLVILADIKKKMDGLRTDAQREAFLSRAFGEADQDTIKGLRTLLTGDMLSKINGFTRDIEKGTGTIERDLPRALSNAVDQGGRLKATLIEAADSFGQRINGALSGGIKKLLDSKAQGGMGLSGGELLAGGAAGVGLAYVGGRVMKGTLGKLLGGTASLGTGVAMGQALEKAGAATPVFIVGAAPGVMGGGIGGVGLPGAAGGAAGGAATAARLGGLRLLGARALLAGGSSVFGAGGLMGAGAGGIATTAGGVGLAALGGWGVGSLINMGINSNKYTRNAFQFLAAPGLRNLSYGMAALGNDDARATVSDEFRQGRGMTRLEMATAGTPGPFNWLAQTLIRLNNERKAAAEERQKMDATINLRVTDARVTATVGAVNFTGGPVAVRSTSGPPTGRMMPGAGK